MKLKIIAGEFRSRMILSPEESSESRPYGSRVKESIFNLLRGWFEGATVLDLFAGVGTMGLEAVSRGAANVFMVEKDRRVFELLERNIKTLGCEDRAKAVHGDALAATSLARAPRPVDVIFVDPPYQIMEDERSRQRALDQIERCRELMGARGFVVLRGPMGIEGADMAIPGFAGPETHKYGQEMRVLLYSPSEIADEHG